MMNIILIVLGVIAIFNAFALYCCIVVGARSEREWKVGDKEMR